jgi:hypothetical protein
MSPAAVDVALMRAVVCVIKIATKPVQLDIPHVVPTKLIVGMTRFFIMGKLKM